jgi:hypothetical protein
MAASMPGPLVRRRHPRFYNGMSLLIAAIVFAGFSRTFYLSPWLHGPALSPLRIVHGVAFSAWIVLFVAQTTLVAAGRTDLHRRLGVAGAVLAAGMVVLGTVLAIANAREGHAPPGIPPLVFLIIPLFDMVVFAPMVAAAVWYRHRPETHKRLMLLATLSLLAAAVARLPTALAAAGPLFYFGVVDLLILTGVLYDRVTRGKVHPVYVWGGLAILASQVIRIALSGTSAWLAVATWLTAG